MFEIDNDLKDIVICALRYAIGRKTYITLTTCEFIMKHPELIDKRVKQVMLEDLKKTIDYYETTDIDFPCFMRLAEWLKNLDVEEYEKMFEVN